MLTLNQQITTIRNYLSRTNTTIEQLELNKQDIINENTNISLNSIDVSSNLNVSGEFILDGSFNINNVMVISFDYGFSSSSFLLFVSTLPPSLVMRC